MQDDAGSTEERFRMESTLVLVRRAQAGERQAMNDLLELYLPRLSEFLHARLGSAGRDILDTQDLVVEVAAEAAAALPGFEYRGIGSFWAFLRTLAARRAIDAGRAGRRRPAAAHLSDDSRHAPAASDVVSAGIQRSEDLERVDATLARLDDKLRTAFMLRYELGLEYATIARELDYGSEGAARMAVSRAVKALSEMLGK